MKLNDRLLTEITFRGRRYRLNLWTRNMLDAIDALHDDEITPEDGIDVALGALVRGRIPRDPHYRYALLTEIFHALNGSDHPKFNEKPVMSMTQDAELIIAAFRQAYGIDLQTERLHWQTFQALLGAIPTDTRLGEVIAIRARPLPKPTKHNAEEISALMKAKASVAITMTEEEREHALDSDLRSLAGAFISMARK